jgi:hypothetical protein
MELGDVHRAHGDELKRSLVERVALLLAAGTAGEERKTLTVEVTLQRARASRRA